MNPITERQTELFKTDDYTSHAIGDYEWENSGSVELGTKKISVPNSPLPELGTKKIPVPNSEFDELGTKKIPVPNSLSPELGTEKILVPNSEFDELGTGKTTLTRAEIWKPPIGLLVQTWVKTDWYWYWKYYDNRRKKKSIYLGKKYNKAVAKAQLIGMPADAKSTKIRASPPET